MATYNQQTAATDTKQSEEATDTKYSEEVIDTNNSKEVTEDNHSEISVQESKGRVQITGNRESTIDIEEALRKLREMEINTDRTEEFTKYYAENLYSYKRLQNIMNFHLNEDWSEITVVDNHEEVSRQFVTSFSPKVFKTADALQEVFDEWIVSNNMPSTDIIKHQSEWVVENMDKLDNLKSLCRNMIGARFCSTYIHARGASMLQQRSLTSSREDLLSNSNLEDDVARFGRNTGKQRYQQDQVENERRENRITGDQAATDLETTPTRDQSLNEPDRNNTVKMTMPTDTAGTLPTPNAEILAELDPLYVRPTPVRPQLPIPIEPINENQLVGNPQTANSPMSTQNHINEAQVNQPLPLQTQQHINEDMSSSMVNNPRYNQNTNQRSNVNVNQATEDKYVSLRDIRSNNQNINQPVHSPIQTHTNACPAASATNNSYNECVSPTPRQILQESQRGNDSLLDSPIDTILTRPSNQTNQQSLPKDQPNLINLQPDNQNANQANQMIQALVSALSQLIPTQAANAQGNATNSNVQPPVVMTATPITMEPLNIPMFPGFMEEYHNWKDYVLTTMEEMKLSYSLRTKYIWTKLDKDTIRRLQHVDINASDSYNELWKELDKMFDRKELLKTHCVSKLLALATWKEATSIIQVRALHDYVVEYINKLRKATGDPKDGNSYNQLLYRLCPNHVKNLLESDGEGTMDATLIAMRKHLEREENKANKAGINPYNKGKSSKQVYSLSMSNDTAEDIREAEKLLGGWKNEDGLKEEREAERLLGTYVIGKEGSQRYSGNRSTPKIENKVWKKPVNNSNQVYIPSSLQSPSTVEISTVPISNYKIPETCIFCSKSHSPHKCNKFNQAGKFWDMVYKEKLCRNCLEADHQVENCRYDRFCTCDQLEVTKHSVLLHNHSRGTKLVVGSTSILSNAVNMKGTPRLQTIKMKMRKTSPSGNERWVTGRGFLDSGSMINLGSNSLTEAMELETLATEKVKLKPWGGQEIEVDGRWTEIEIAPVNREEGMKINVLSVPQSNGIMQGRELRESQKRIIQDKQMTLADPEVTTNKDLTVDLLLGVNVFYRLMFSQETQPEVVWLPDQLVAVKSPFGYILAGGGEVKGLKEVRSLSLNCVSLGITGRKFPMFMKEEDVEDTINETSEKQKSDTPIRDTKIPEVSESKEICPVNNKKVGHSLEVNNISMNIDEDRVLYDDEIQGIMNHFIGADDIGEDIKDQEISPIIKEFEDKVKFSNNRAESPFPWILKKKEKLDPHFNLCFTRCNSAYRRRSRNGNEELQKKVTEYLNEQVTNNVIAKVKEVGDVQEILNNVESNTNYYNKLPEDGSIQVHYMPYQEVYKPSTGKLRLVYDASAKKHHWDWSLNECLEKGPLLTNHIIQVLMEFRMRRVACIADIEKAFLQILVSSSDSDMLRFLWREGNNISIYKFLRLPFGLRCSPFILAATLQTYIKTADLPQEMKNKIISSFYVDDLTASFETEEEALQFISKVTDLLEEIGMPLRKLNSNAESVRKEFEKREKQERPLEEKVLGMNWKVDSDTIEVNSSRILQKLDKECTKVDVLSVMAQLFDPMNLLSPFVFPAKEILREACNLKLDWKKHLPEMLRIKWEKWKKEVMNIKLVQVPRQLVVNNANKIKLAGYSDASSRGYAAVIYIVSENEEGGKDSNMMISKTKVKPIIEQTVPRMELMGAVKLVKLMAVILNLIKHLKIQDISYHSDSNAVLGWIKSNKLSQPPFIANRIKTINTLSDSRQWKYVASASNPADIPTRGSSLTKLAVNRLWWKGPTELIQNENSTSGEDSEKDSNEKIEIATVKHETDIVSEDVTEVINVMLIQEKEVDGIGNLIPSSFTGNYHRLMKLTQLMLTAIEILRRKYDGKRVERSSAERIWFQYIQERHFGEEIAFCSTPADQRSKSKKTPPRVKWLRLWYDSEDKLLKLKTRTLHQEFNIPPILLPYNSNFTRMYVISQHIRLGHAGVRAVLTDIRSQVWIPRGRKLVTSVVDRCRTCRLVNARPFRLPEAPSLPECRLKFTRPFDTIGLDYAGPIELRSGVGYSLIITCAVTRGVHIQAVKSMSKKDFVNALTRFMCRRGIPSLIISDNAKTFKSCASSLKELCNLPEIKEYLDRRRVSWRFYTDRSPWKGGFIETIVKMFKAVLKKVTSRSRIIYEEFDILNHEAEMIINSRPLSYIYDNPSDGEPLTPSKLIHGYNLTDLPPFKNVDWKLRTKSLNATMRMLNHLRLQLRQCLQKEYLRELTEKHLRVPPTGEIRQPKVDEIVLIKGEKTVPRTKWQMGRIMEVYKDGRDGKIRTIKLQPVEKQAGRVDRNSVDLTEPIFRSVNWAVPLEGELPYYVNKD